MHYYYVFNRNSVDLVNLHSGTKELLGKDICKSMHKIWMNLCKIEHFNSESALFSTGYVFFKWTFLPIFYFEIALLGFLVREACVTVP